MRFRSHESVLRVRIPPGVSPNQVSSFMMQNQAWILKEYQARLTQLARRQETLRQFRGGEVQYLGKPLSWTFSPAATRRAYLRPEGLVIQAPASAIRPDSLPLLYGALRALAKAHLVKRTRALAKETDSHIARIFIKDHKSKWGSCSEKRNINLNWHLILLPEPLIDYVIIHELMHLREMNHSRRFWKWVETFYPDYRQAEKNLKQYQWLIGIFDA